MAGTESAGIDAEWFRAHGHAVVDWIADYLSNVERYPVLSRVAPGDVRRALPSAPPQAPEPMDSILSDFERVVVPGITHWNHPAFLAYFAISGSPPGILGELLSAALNVNGMLWRTSPAATELEEVALDWLRQMLGLPAGFGGVITDTASMSTMLALAAAREATGLRVREEGLAGRSDAPRLRLYASEQAHSSVDKSAIALGIGLAGVRKITVDDAYRMRADALGAAVAEDRARGWLPFAAVATVGTTSTTSIDPVRAVAEVCALEGLWLHVDGAYGGVAAIVPEFRQVLDGCEQADSIVVNPHKWLLTPIDCSALFVRDIERLRRAFTLVPEYLRTAEADAGAVTDYMDYGVQLGRRFRALKLWMVIRAYGVDGLADHIRRCCRMASELAGWVHADPAVERLAPAPFSTVCFRYHPASVEDDDLLAAMNAAVLDAVNRSGEAFLSHTVLAGRYALRLAVGNMATEPRHVRRAWELVREAAMTGCRGTVL
jgi:aromatic-L-amino-acid decarboxylase